MQSARDESVNSRRSGSRGPSAARTRVPSDFLADARDTMAAEWVESHPVRASNSELVVKSHVIKLMKEYGNLEEFTRLESMPDEYVLGNQIEIDAQDIETAQPRVILRPSCHRTSTQMDASAGGMVSALKIGKQG